MTRAAILAVALFMMAQLAAASSRDEQDSKHPACTRDHLPTVWAFATPPIGVEDNFVTLDSIGVTSARMQFRNSSGGRVSAAALVVEYLDSNGEVLDIVPMLGAVKSIIGTFQTSFPIQRLLANPWPEPVSDGQDLQVEGVKAGMSTSICPASARVTFLKLRFDNGTVRSSASPDWKVLPTPRVVPRVGESFHVLDTNSLINLSATITIDASGRVRSVRANGEEPASVIMDWFRSWMQERWTFNPAISGGHPVDWELAVLLRIQPQAHLASLVPVLGSAATLIQIVSKDDSSGAWLVYYGTLLQGDTVR